MKAFGTVKEGKLKLNNSRQFQDSLREFEGKDVELKIRERSDILSKDIGYTKEEMHTLIKYKFLKRNVVDENGVEQEVIKSTTTLTTKEFSLLMNDVLFWSNNTLNINLPSNE